MSGFFAVKFRRSTFVAIGALVFVLLLIAGMDVQIKKSRTRARLSGAAAQDMSRVTTSPSAASPSRDVRLEWGTDPFGNKFSIPVAHPESQTDTDEEESEEPLFVFRLQGIVRGPRGETALINGELMRIGDTIEGVRLLDIGQGYVILSQRGRSTKLTMDPQ